ncbi:bis(5'-adenosyl)-triphosphatase ENPP4-like [Porites lutea]|uniref:bis(5'-adenosyl)-triphosphatase ENPP4-like n=1 Tax=Porites lutea TaxID=51062 RepID=UPI003CC67DFA
MFLIVLASFCLQFTYAGAEIKPGEPPLVIVSLDGMDWRVLKNHRFTPNLDFIARTGVTADYIKNVVPSSTWPNHHSLLTGLYSENHGIVANKFWDPVYEEIFIFGFDCSNFDPKFYNNSEPLWLTVQKQGGRSASYFWPATTSYAEKPTYHAKETCLIDCGAINSKDLPKYRNRTFPGFPPYIHCAFNLRGPWADRVNNVTHWLLSDAPPHFVALYFEEPDTTGHEHGPSSQQYLDAVENADKNAVGFLLKRLNESHLLEKVNLIIVSDHGMDSTSSSRQVYLDDYIDSSSYFLTESGPLVHIWPHPGMREAIYQNLTKNPIPHIRRIFKKEDIPSEYHWKNNRRIPPIFIDPEVGWVVTRSRNDTLASLGEHGWPPVESKSYSVFYARGPSFREGTIVEPFKTVDLYPLMCQLLGIDPHPNNGSLENVKAVLKDPSPSGIAQFAPLPKLGLISLLFAILFTFA